jgi:hypothetical protein
VNEEVIVRAGLQSQRKKNVVSTIGQLLIKDKNTVNISKVEEKIITVN